MKKTIAAFAALSLMLVACTDDGGDGTGDTGTEDTGAETTMTETTAAG